MLATAQQYEYAGPRQPPAGEAPRLAEAILLEGAPCPAGPLLTAPHRCLPCPTFPVLGRAPTCNVRGTPAQEATVTRSKEEALEMIKARGAIGTTWGKQDME